MHETNKPDSNVPAIGGRRASLKVWVLSVLAIVAVAAWTVSRRSRVERISVHDPGKVYRSAYLDPDEFRELIRAHQIRTVVNLCTKAEKQPRIRKQRSAIRKAGAKLMELSFPTNDTWHVQAWQFRRIERLFQDPANYPIWIHSAEGKDRTAKALLIYDIQQRGMTARESLMAMPDAEDHSWHVISFAHGYQTWMTRQMAKERQSDESKPRPAGNNDPAATARQSPLPDRLR